MIQRAIIADEVKGILCDEHDSEISALRACYVILGAVTRDEQTRILWWLESRLRQDDGDG